MWETFLQGGTFDLIITSPPYWGHRKYPMDTLDENGRSWFVGMEKSVKDYFDNMCAVYRGCYEILNEKGLFFLNADNGKRINRQLIAPGWMHCQMAMDVGFHLAMQIIWYDPNKTPINSDRLLKHNYEPIFVLFKDKDYNFYKDELRVPYSKWYDKLENPDGSFTTWGTKRNFKKNPRGADRGDVWRIHHARGCHGGTKGERLHCAPFPEELIELIVKSGSLENGWVYDPFAGSGTVGVVCKRLQRNFVGTEIIKEYVELANKRIKGTEI